MVQVVPTLPAGVHAITNTVRIGDDGSNGPDQVPADNQFTITTPVNAAPDLVITKSDGGITAEAGGSIVYTLFYTNTGTQDAANVVLTETLPANTSYTGVGWNPAAPGVYTQSLGVLAAGASGQVEFAVTVNAQLPAGVTTVFNSVTIGDDGSNGADLNPG